MSVSGASAAANGINPPSGGDLERRVTILETRFDALLPMLATKKDPADLRGDLVAEMAKLRGDLVAEMAKLRGEIRAEMAELRGEMRSEMATDNANQLVEMHKLINRQIRWMVGTLIALFIAFVGVTHYG